MRSQKIKAIDLLIATHPHADHIGQFPQILDNFAVDEVWMSGDLHTTRTFERALDAILATEARYKEPRAGEVYEIGSALIEVIHPENVTGDLNNGSLVLKVTYGEISFLFTGDAERKAEQEILQRGLDVQANILKVGHHGSRSSSTVRFIEAVKPEVAVYSAGQGNSYGYPHPEVIARLQQQEITVYGTDVNGTVKVVTDGNGYEVQLENNRLRAPPLIQVASTCVDINTANRSELMSIIHIGEVRVNELIRLRPYRSIDQLTRIRRIATGSSQPYSRMKKS